MSKQRPDADKIANELRGASGFFKRASEATTPPNQDESTTPSPPSASPARPPVRGVRPTKRQMIRHPFELYMDQLDRLRALADAQRRRGELGSMSKMVRDALDRFLDEQGAAD